MNGLIVLFVMSAMSAIALAEINPPGCGKRPLANAAHDKIVGGSQAIAGDWGWMTGMKRNGAFICGGSLMNKRHIITAAHCIFGSTNPANYLMEVGMHDRLQMESWTQSMRVQTLIMHPQYSQSTLRHDIALMKLTADVIIDNYYIIPVCIPAPHQDWAGNQNDCWATGWGTLFSGGSVSRYNMQVQMPHLHDARCRERFGTRVNTTEQCCAGEVGFGLDTCQGDSGGPYVCHDKAEDTWYLVGLTSWGFGCGDGGVYTKVNGYHNWVIQNSHL